MNPILRMEWKKLWIKHNAWLFVCSFSLVLILSWQNSIHEVYQGKPRDGAYFQYLDKVEGKLSDDKEAFLEKEAITLNTALKDLDQLYTDYYDNKINEKEFRARKSQLLQRASGKSGFEQIFKQYLYARENKENRYILDDRAWSPLLSSVNIDYWLILIILLTIIPLFIQEYEHGVSDLNHSTRLGSRKLVENKLFFTLSLSVSFCIAFYFFRLLYFYLTCGLKYGNYPIQSLVDFATSGKKISILGAYFLLSVLKSLAFISFALLLAFFSALFKKYAPTLFCGLAVIMLPQFIPAKSPLFYILAFPSGFMLAEGFLYGNQIEIDPFSGEEMIARKEIPMIYLYLTIGIYLLSCVLLFFVTRYMESNVFVRKKLLKKMPLQIKISRFIILLLFVQSVFLVGCQNRQSYSIEEGKGQTFYYNMTDRDIRAGDYSFSFEDPGDGKSMRIIKRNDKTHKETRVDFDPTLPLDSTHNHLFSDGQKLYITVPSSTKLNGTTTNHSIGKRYKPSRNFLSIYSIDLLTNNTRLIFEKNLDPETFIFFSTFSFSSALSSELVFIQGANIWINDDYIFFLTDDLWQYDRKTGAFQKLKIPLSRHNVAFDGKKIHYIDEQFRLSVYDPSSEEYSSNPDQIALDFILRPEGIYFLNRKDGNRLFFKAVKSETAKRILNKPLLAIWQDNGDIFYMEKNDYEEKKLPEKFYP